MYDLKKILLLTFDLEEFDVPFEYGIRIDEDEMYGISCMGLKRILRLLQKHGIKSTFFTTVNFAKRYPEMIKRLLKKHEIALQGYSHAHDYQKMPKMEALKWLKKSKQFFEELGVDIIGFRAPRLIPPLYSVLKKIGFEYDNSLHPTYVPGRYNNLLKPRKPFVVNSLKIIPISTTPFFRLPFSWVWFRNIDLMYSKISTRFCLINQNFINVYFHPWEFVDLHDYEFSKKLSWLFKRNTGREFEKKLEKYILWCLKINLVPMTIRDSLGLIFKD